MSRQEKQHAGSYIKKNTKIDKSRKDWTVDEDIENFYDSYEKHIHKTRFFIYEHRKNPHLYEPIFKCRSKNKKETIIIFHEYIYARLEQDSQTACTNYIQKIGYQDILKSFRNHFNFGIGSKTDEQCFKHIKNLIGRDTAVMNHWLRTLIKLKSSLTYWINIRIPEILKKEVNKETSRHYTAIKRSQKEKKMFIGNIENESKLFDKSRNAFTYLEEVNKLIQNITRQNTQWETYEFDFNVNLLDDCPDKLKYRKSYESYYEAWPNKIIDDDIDALNDMFSELVENFELDLSVEEVNAMNSEYNRYIEWLQKYKKTIIKKKQVTKQIVDEITPNVYINLAREYAQLKKLTSL